MSDKEHRSFLQAAFAAWQDSHGSLFILEQTTREKGGPGRLLVRFVSAGKMEA